MFRNFEITKSIILIGVAVILLAAIFLVAGIIPPQMVQETEFDSPEDVPTAAPALNLPPDLKVIFSENAENYAVSSARNPYFVQVIIDPRDVRLGEVQKLLVRLQDPYGVRAVTAKTELDNSFLSLPLELIWGNEEDGIWFLSWTVHDTHDRHYITAVTAENVYGHENSLELVWKDPHSCDGPLGGDWTVSTSCSTSGVAGADNGNIVVNAGATLTVTVGTSAIWNPGYSVSNNGTIAVGGQLFQTYLWIRDADADGHAPNATDQLAQSSQPTSYRRRYTASGTNDCNDADGAKWQYLTGYQDADGDAYTVGGGQSTCSGVALPAGWRSSPSSPGDCYDVNANARPGQTAYFTGNRGDGSFDYNCDGGISYQYSFPYGICSCNAYSVCSSSANTSQYGNPGCGNGWTYYYDTVCNQTSVTQACL